MTLKRNKYYDELINHAMDETRKTKRSIREIYVRKSASL